jgi:arsenite methyltransferase
MSQSSISSPNLLPNYRLETPAHLQHVLIAGMASGLAGLILMVLLPESQRGLALLLLLLGGTAFVITILLVLVTNDRVRRSAQCSIMDAVDWRGDETVLDVGCGNGFLLIEAAKHLKTGKAIGIDVWVEGSGGQNEVSAQHNARIEGVSDKIEVQNVDARTMPFNSETFDVIVSSLALHHISGHIQREQALEEMIRVLKPDGVILLYDMFPMINQAATVMKQHKMKQIKRRGGFILTILGAHK